MTRAELMALVAVRKAEIEAHETDLVEVLTAARAGLTPTPTQGAPWDAETRYIAGDTVEGGYVALRYSRGKNPTDHLGTYWTLQTVTYPAWSDIEDGTVITEDTIVTHEGKSWRCISQHIKSAVYRPKTGSSKWSEYAE